MIECVILGFEKFCPENSFNFKYNAKVYNIGLITLLSKYTLFPF